MALYLGYESVVHVRLSFGDKLTMLLDFMRRNTRNLLIATIVLIVPAFILWGAFPTMGSKEKRTLMKVGDQKVSLEEFATYYHNLRETARSNFGANYSPELEKLLNLKQQALDRMVRELVLGQEVERMDIVVSDEEVQDSLKNNPVFYTDGEFDPAKWNAAINDPRINWPMLVEQERETLKMRRLVEMIRSAARVTEEEIRSEYRRQHEKVRVEFIALKAADLIGKVEVTPDDLASYYEQNKRQYAEPARVKLSYVELKREPSPQDYADVKHFAENILERARAGDDFADLAERYSDDDTTAPQGGDLGFFPRGRMVKEFEEAAFSMKPGEISDVVQTPFGYHIIKVEETRGEGKDKEVHARHILIEVEPSDDTLLSLEERATRLALDAQNSSLEQAASEMNISVSTTPEFVESSAAIPDIGPVPEITEILPGLGEGYVSDVIEAKDAFYVIQVAERTPERIPELSEVENEVRAAVRLEKALELAETRAEEIVSEVNENGLALADIPEAPEPQETAPFTRRGRPSELPWLSGLATTAFELSEGEAAGPFMNPTAAYVVQLKEKIDADPAGYEAQKESIKNRLLMERREQVFEDYYENLREKIKVKIDRDLLQAV